MGGRGVPFGVRSGRLLGRMCRAVSEMRSGRRGRRGGETDLSLGSVDEFDGTFVDEGEEAERGWDVRHCRRVPEIVQEGCGL